MPSMEISELTQERNYVCHTVQFILEKSKIVFSAKNMNLCQNLLNLLLSRGEGIKLALLVAVNVSC